MNISPRRDFFVPIYKDVSMNSKRQRCHTNCPCGARFWKVKKVFFMFYLRTRQAKYRQNHFPPCMTSLTCWSCPYNQVTLIVIFLRRLPSYLRTLVVYEGTKVIFTKVFIKPWIVIFTRYLRTTYLRMYLRIKYLRNICMIVYEDSKLLDQSRSENMRFSLYRVCRVAHLGNK